ncbi:MAG TPA: fused MFS/spermidine synthase [Bryobacteraceae bacterium]
MAASNTLLPANPSTRDDSASTSVDSSTATPATPLWPYYLLFFTSGFPALLYQIVWERALFTIYGVNIESVTIIVTVFLLGLGIGSLAGGKLSTHSALPLLRTFAAIELSIGAFGAFSLTIFRAVALYTAGVSTVATGVITFFLLIIPTLLMGSTLPLLTAHLVRRTRNVGESVGSLYCVNTFGSAVACYAAAIFLMREFGESGSVRLAAVINGCVGLTALFLDMKRQGNIHLTSRLSYAPISRRSQPTIPFVMGMVLAGVVGFVSLAYEIIWYRLYSFTSAGAAPSFAKLLAFYLAGIAYGSLAVRDICVQKAERSLQRTLAAGSTAILLGSTIGFLYGPTLSFLAPFAPYDLAFTVLFVASAFLGAAFPLLSHAAIDPTEEAGTRLSYLYLSNIIGSAGGSFLVGFIVLDHWSTEMALKLLLVLGVAISASLALLAKPLRWTPRLVAWTASLCLAAFSGASFSHIYERLLFKNDIGRAPVFQELVENRSGIIAVTADGTVIGGGAYDGKFSTDLVNDQNGIFRAYAIAALHPYPKDVLVIGLSSGSWAQVLVHHPAVERMTVVEINPGYLGLIKKHPNVASLLRNPKFHIEIDDGRRWLMAHPDRLFDFILMNTTFNWRANTSNLLSHEFLQLIHSHLRPGGVHYFNTTWSGDAQRTAGLAFPYALRVANFLAVSDRPLFFNRALWQQTLMKYKIDAKPVFDLTKESNRQRLQEVLAIPDRAHERKDAPGISIETRLSLLGRLQTARIITDDNMGTEWRPNH